MSDKPNIEPLEGGYPEAIAAPTPKQQKTLRREIRRSLKKKPDAPIPVLLLLSLLSAILMALSLPNELFKWGNPLIGLFALVPLFYALSLRPSLRLSFLMGGIYGFTAHALSSYWLWFFKGYAILTLGSTSLTYFFIYGFVCAWLSLAASKGRQWRPLLIAFGWVAYEYQKSIGFLGYPWGLLPYSWNTVLPFIQIADITGVYGPGLILALTNAVISEFLLAIPGFRRAASLKSALQPHIRSAAIVLACFALAFGYGFFRLSTTQKVEKYLRAVMVQPNEDSWAMNDENTRIEGLMALTREGLERSPNRNDVILWSESSLDRPWVSGGRPSRYERVPYGDPLKLFISDTGTPLFTGGPMNGQNSVSLIDADGDFVGSYGKMHPVPFAEAIPYADKAWMQKLMEKVAGFSVGWEIGKEYILFSIPLQEGGSFRFGAPICFEDAFSDLCRDFVNLGAEALVNLTNDSWSKTDSAEIQHLVAARFRSIENRRVLIRSTNAGVSCWVDAKGALHDVLPLFQATSSTVRIPITAPEGPTAFTQSGEAFAKSIVFIFFFLSVILIFAGSFRKERRL